MADISGEGFKKLMEHLNLAGRSLELSYNASTPTPKSFFFLVFVWFQNWKRSEIGLCIDFN